MDKNIVVNLKVMSDKKKFWFITVVYLVVFWILPMWTNSFFNILGFILEKIYVDIASALVYFFIFLPILILIVYISFLRELIFRFKKTLFTLFFILLPYIFLFIFFILSIIEMVSNPGFLSF